MRLVKLAFGVWIAALTIGSATAQPDYVTETITTFDPYEFNLNGTSFNPLSVPTYDNSRFTLRSVVVRFDYDQNFDYFYDNQRRAEFGDQLSFSAGASSTVLGTL